jgi:hypothetical protein
MGRLGRSTLAMLGAALALAPAAHAASRWRQELTIFPPQDEAANRIGLVMTPSGDVLAERGSYAESRLRLTSSLDRGPFGHRRFFTGRYPGLMSDGAGRILAFQYREPGDEARIVMRTGSVTGRFGRGQTVAEGRNVFLNTWVSATSPTGDLFYVWSTESVFCACLDRLHVRVRARGHEEFGPAQTLSPPNRSAWNAKIAFDRRGNALLAWEQDYDVNRGRLAYALRPAGASTFGPTHTLPAGSSNGAVFKLDLAASPSGRAVAVWSSRAEPLRDVRSSVGTVKRGFHSIERVTSGRAGDPHIVVDKDGEALASWSGPSPTIAVAPPGKEFGKPRALERGRATGPAVANDGAGTYTLSWRHLPHGDLHVARRRVGSHSVRVIELDSRRVYRATLAVTAAHETLVAWNLLERGSLRFHVDVTLRGARVAIARPRHGFGRPLTLSDDSWGSGFPVDRVEIAVDGAGGAFVWWRREVVRGVPGHYGRFLVP